MDTLEHVVESTHDFFSVFLPTLGVFTAILVGFTCATCSCVACSRWSMHRWGWQANNNKLVQYLIILAMGAFALTIACRAVGIDFWQTGLLVGLFSIAISSGCSQTIANISAAVTLQFDPIAEHHTAIRIPGTDEYGRIIAMNLFRTEVAPFVSGRSGPLDYEFTHHVPNSILVSTVTKYGWRQARPTNILATTAPAAYAYTSSEFVSVGAAKRNSDALDEESGQRARALFNSARAQRSVEEPDVDEFFS